MRSVSCWACCASITVLRLLVSRATMCVLLFLNSKPIDGSRAQQTGLCRHVARNALHALAAHLCGSVPVARFGDDGTRSLDNIEVPCCVAMTCLLLVLHFAPAIHMQGYNPVSTAVTAFTPKQNALHITKRGPACRKVRAANYSRFSRSSRFTQRWCAASWARSVPGTC